MQTAARRRKWSWFAAWMLPGICLAFGVTALGVFAVPVGLVVIAVLLVVQPSVGALGLLAGLGAVVTWIGSINLDYQPCSSNHGSLSLAPGSAHSASYSCGGVNGVPWMIVGLCAAIAAVAVWLRVTRPAPPAGGSSAGSVTIGSGSRSPT